jgi:peptide-methionine (S)-S-oxide reductase
MNQYQEPRTATATLAGGCFWCLEAVYDQLAGVTNVKSGYAGGHKPNPTYEEVCTGTTGHAEVVTLTYDPAQVSYRDLLRVFFTIHDPTTKDRQGNDIGTQYRSAIYYVGDEQRAVAEEVMEEVRQQGLYPAPLVTELEPLGELYPAETYHDDYYARNPNQGYCAAVIAPKVAKFRKQYYDRLKRTPEAAAGL